MKVCLILTVVFVAFAIVASAAEIKDPEEPHTMQKRETIQGPDFPNRCVFYECIASCRQRGKSGGYCTLNGCQCLR